MRALTAVVALFFAGPLAAQECTAELERMSELVARSGMAQMVPLSTAETDGEGRCRLEGLEFRAGRSVVVKADALIWSGEGRERFLRDNLPPLSLELDLTGLRVVPEIGDPVMTYLLDVQSRARPADLSIRVGWDEAENVLEWEKIELRFAGGDYVRYQAIVEDVDLSSMNAIQMSAGSFGITRTVLEVRSQGLFEAYALMPLGMALLHGEADPAARVEELKRRARSEISRLPETIFPPESKSSLANLADDMPAPAGTLRVEMTANPGLGTARGMQMALRGEDLSDLAEIWPLLEGVRYDIGYERH